MQCTVQVVCNGNSRDVAVSARPEHFAVSRFAGLVPALVLQLIDCEARLRSEVLNFIWMVYVPSRRDASDLMHVSFKSPYV